MPLLIKKPFPSLEIEITASNRILSTEIYAMLAPVVSVRGRFESLSHIAFWTIFFSKFALLEDRRRPTSGARIITSNSHITISVFPLGDYLPDGLTALGPGSQLAVRRKHPEAYRYPKYFHFYAILV